MDCRRKQGDGWGCGREVQAEEAEEVLAEKAEVREVCDGMCWVGPLVQPRMRYT